MKINRKKQCPNNEHCLKKEKKIKTPMIKLTRWKLLSKKSKILIIGYLLFFFFLFWIFYEIHWGYLQYPMDCFNIRFNLSHGLNCSSN